MSGSIRDPLTGRIFPVDDRTGREIEDPAIVEARRAAAEQRNWIAETDRVYAAASPAIKAWMDKVDRSYWHALAEAAHQARAEGKRDGLQQGIATGRAAAIEDAAFRREWSAEGLRMAVKAGFSEELLREDFHKRFIAAGGDMRSYWPAPAGRKVQGNGSDTFRGSDQCAARVADRLTARRTCGRARSGCSCGGGR